MPCSPKGAKVSMTLGFAFVNPTTMMKSMAKMRTMVATELNMDEPFVLTDAPMQTTMEITTAIGSKLGTWMRKSFGLWLHNVAKYEVHDLATPAPDTTYSNIMLPAAI
ncbi:hypothetical protein V2J09_018678 [Rumex salicifolius]